METALRTPTIASLSPVQRLGIDDCTVNQPFLYHLQRALAVRNTGDLNIVSLKILDDLFAPGFVRFDHQQAFDAAADVITQMRYERVQGIFAVTGLGRNAKAPLLNARSRESSVEMTHTGMCRLARLFLSRSSTRHPSMSGK